MRPLTLFHSSIVAILVACVALPAHARDPIVLMVGGIEKQIYIPAKLAETLGYFQEQDLDVELVSEPAGVNAEDELLAGAVHGVVGFYDHTIDLQARGKAVVAVVQFSQSPGEVALVAAARGEAIRSPADFKGRRLGITGFGSSTSFLTRYLASRAGVNVGEFTEVPVEAGDTFIAAVRTHRIDAGMTSEPTASRLLKSGDARVLVDLRTPEASERELGGLYPAACLYMQTAWVNGHRAQVQRLVNAFVKALRYMQAHSAEDIASRLPAAFYAGDRELYVHALARSKAMFTPDGRMPASGPATVLKVLATVQRRVQAKRIDLSKTTTSEFVEAVP